MCFAHEPSYALHVPLTLPVILLHHLHQSFAIFVFQDNIFLRSFSLTFRSILFCFFVRMFFVAIVFLVSLCELRSEKSVCAAHKLVVRNKTSEFEA